MSKNYYENNKFLLFFAVSKAFSKENIGRNIQDWEIEHIEAISKAYESEIKTAKQLIEQDKYYDELEIHKKIELATWIVEYLYEEKEEGKDKEVKFRVLV